jgi:Arc/MetJ-type ribon-helix-helix transcriptional regulator
MDRRPVCVSLPSETLAWVDEVAQERHVSRSDVVRAALLGMMRAGRASPTIDRLEREARAAELIRRSRLLRSILKGWMADVVYSPDVRARVARAIGERGGRVTPERWNTITRTLEARHALGEELMDVARELLDDGTNEEAQFARCARTIHARKEAP